VQTAFNIANIANVSFSPDPVAPGVVELTVNRQLFKSGPSHVCGRALVASAALYEAEHASGRAQEIPSWERG
jgi:hypothetical protein